MEIAFMIFGIGFFVYGIYMHDKQDDIAYQRKLNEAREFGFRDVPPSSKHYIRQKKK